MKIPTTLPITAEQSRAARFQLGLTQANVIEESRLPGHKLKNFETGRFVPDMPFLEGLRDYYTQKGIDFAEADTPNDQATVQGQNWQQQNTPVHGGAMVRPVSRMCFYVNDQLEPEVIDRILGRMDGNDDRIAALLQSPLKGGFLSTYDEETEAKQRELFGAMAENYLLFRILQGRNIVSALPAGVEPATHADLLATFFATSPIAIIGSQPQAAKAMPVETVDASNSEGGEE